MAIGTNKIINKMAISGINNKIKLFVFDAFYKKINFLCNLFYTILLLIQSLLPEFKVIIEISILSYLRSGYFSMVIFFYFFYFSRTL
jgi:hypothetical protein